MASIVEQLRGARDPVALGSESLPANWRLELDGAGQPSLPAERYCSVSIKRHTFRLTLQVEFGVSRGKPGDAIF